MKIKALVTNSKQAIYVTFQQLAIQSPWRTSLLVSHLFKVLWLDIGGQNLSVDIVLTIKNLLELTRTKPLQNSSVTFCVFSSMQSLRTERFKQVPPIVDVQWCFLMNHALQYPCAHIDSSHMKSGHHQVTCFGQRVSGKEDVSKGLVKPLHVGPYSLRNQ